MTGSFLISMGDFFSVATVIGAGFARLSLSRFDTNVGSVSMPFRDLLGTGSCFILTSGVLVLIAFPR